MANCPAATRKPAPRPIQGNPQFHGSEKYGGRCMTLSHTFETILPWRRPWKERGHMDFCFVHAADLHLGGRRWLRSVPEDPELAERAHFADRLALSALVDLCLSERASMLICAGD